jgi:phosphate transport system substrate-binding protein
MGFLKKAAHGALFTILLAVALLMTSCIGGAPSGSGSVSSGGGAARLQGAGASFPNPLYQRWLSEYGRINPNVQIDYQSQGSAAGIRLIQQRTIDFGGTDAPMTTEALRETPGILHIPTVLGAVVITYNLQGASQPLRFSPDVLADIFLGRITRWDDARVRADNPGVNLPAENITVVRRSDGSGTTAVFTDYLSKVSGEWRDRVGTGTSPQWPTGLGGRGNEGVTGMIRQTPNTIGYVELAYAVQNNLPVAQIKNRAGNFVSPTLEAVTAAAAESLATTPEDMRVSITDAAGADVYPIAAYTYILVYQEQQDAAKGRALVDFLWWGIHDGQNFARDLQYAPLPPEIVRRAEARISSITSGGRPLRQ